MDTPIPEGMTRVVKSDGTITFRAKRGTKSGHTGKAKDTNLAAYPGLFVYDESGQLVYDTDANGVKTARRQRIEGALLFVSAENPNGYNPDTMQSLVKGDFKKLGDFYRYRASLYRFQADKMDKEALAADANKPTGAAGKQAKQASQIALLAKVLLEKLGPDAFKAMCEAQGLDISELPAGTFPTEAPSVATEAPVSA